MRVYEASTRISAEFGGIRDLSRHLSLNLKKYAIHNLIDKNEHSLALCLSIRS